MIPFRGINNPGSGGGAPPVSRDHQAPKIIVGNASQGDTISVCDFLDTGNGAQLVVALAAAAGLGGIADVWIRPGIIDLGLAGGPIVPLAIPTNVTMRGSSPRTTGIQSRASGDMGIVTLDNLSAITDIGLLMPVTTALGVGSTALITCNGATTCYVDNVEYFCEAYNAAQALNLAIRSIVRVTNGPDRVFVNRLRSRFLGFGGAPSLHALGVGGDFFMVETVSGGSNTITYLDDCYLFGGDYGVRGAGVFHLADSTILTQTVGANPLTSADESTIKDNRIRVLGTSGTERGIVVSGVDECKIDNNRIWIEAVAPVVATVGVSMFISSDNTITNNTIRGFDLGVTFDAASATSILGQNRIKNVITPIVDANGTNLIASNL